MRHLDRPYAPESKTNLSDAESFWIMLNHSKYFQAQSQNQLKLHPQKKKTGWFALQKGEEEPGKQREKQWTTRKVIQGHNPR